MKTIGLIGGMSWLSSLEYYRIINQETLRRLGPPHSAKILFHSVDFAEIEALQSADRWDEAGQFLARAAAGLERANADFLVLATNTMHKVAPAIESAVHIPLLHIADATAVALKAAGIQRIGLLATRFTMEQPFYVQRLAENHHIASLTPAPAERAEIHRIIYQELVVGTVTDESRLRFLEIAEQLVMQGAQAIVLGCTEIGLLLRAGDCSVPIFDTTRLHAEAAVTLALS